MKAITSYILPVFFVVSNRKVNMVSLSPSWTEAQSSFSYVFEKKSAIPFKAFSSLFNYIKCTLGYKGSGMIIL